MNETANSTKGKIVGVSELQLGDYVVAVLCDNELSNFTAIVKKIKDEKVTIFRPYPTCTDFSIYGNEVICYTGVEEYTLDYSSLAKFKVLQNSKIR